LRQTFADGDASGDLAAARAGVDGYPAKDIDPRRLPDVLRAVVQGETTYPRRLLYLVLHASAT
jgi:DNA-binding NarL/FixJ family response regulator